MSPELQQAVQERVALGYTKEQIFTELRAAGYTEDVIESVYMLSQDDSQNPFEPVEAVNTPPLTPENQTQQTSQTQQSLIGYGEFVKQSVLLAASAWSIFLKTLLTTILVGVALLLTTGLLFGGIGMLISSPLVIGAGFAVGYILYLTMLIVVIGVMLRSLLLRDQPGTYRSHLRWMFGRIWSALVVSFYQQTIILNALYLPIAIGLLALLTGGAASIVGMGMSGAGGALGTALAFIGGYLLFSILTIVISLYVGWSFFSFAQGTHTGIDAVVRSVQLVSGRFWSVLGRLGVFFIILFVLAFVVSIVLSALFMVQGELMSVLTQMLLAPLVISSGVVLFQSLQATVTPISAEREQTIRTRVKIAVWTGAVALVALVAFMIFTFVMLFSLASSLFMPSGGFVTSPSSITPPTIPAVPTSR